MAEQDKAMQKIKALAHPTRVGILSFLQTRGVGSPNQMSIRLDEPLSNVSYHTKVLLELECIELVKEEPRRGAVEHYYRAMPDAALGSRQWQEVPLALRGDATADALDDLVGCAVEALERGTFQGRDGSRLSTLSLILDETGWKEIQELLDEIGTRTGTILKESASRMPDPAEGTPFLLALAAFETGGSQNGLPSA